MAKVKVKAVRVMARKDGFRRAGFEFGTASRDIPVKDLTKDQLTVLKDESMLMVSEVEIDADAEGEAAATETAKK